MLNISLSTERFLLRSIDQENDDLRNYLAWMKDAKSNIFIQGVKTDYTVEELKQYVCQKNLSNEALLLGIFEKSNGKHIGNIKLEPIIHRRTACIGILIGELNMRHKSVGFEVISSLIEFARSELNLESLYLGVSQNHLVAIKLYTKLGFIRRTPALYIEHDMEMFLSLNLRD